MPIELDDVCFNKAGIMERCLRRVFEEARFDPEFRNQTHIDALVLNLERAVQVCVDVANHWLADEGPPPASVAMAVHEYENLDYGRIYEALSDLGVFEDFGRAILKALD